MNELTENGREVPFFFENHGTRLAAFWHVPEGVEKGRFLFCAPFAEERKSSYRTLVETARAFCQAGFRVLRFDYRGCGDSEGEWHKFAADDWREDIVAAWQLLADSPILPFSHSPFGLLGLRLGASLAIEVVKDLEPLDWLILWEPIVGGKRYLSLQMKRKAMRQMLTEDAGQGTSDAATLVSEESCGDLNDLDGYLLTRQATNQINHIDLAKTSPMEARRALVVQIAAADRVSRELRSLEPSLSSSEVTWDCVKLPPFWNQLGVSDCSTLIERTLGWLNKDEPAVSSVGLPRSIGECRVSVAGEESRITDHASPLTHHESRITLHASRTTPQSETCNLESEIPSAPSLSLVPQVEQFVSFASHNHRLWGVLHTPVSHARGVGVILLHGWGSARVGPHRIFVQQARALCGCGFHCLRFDFRGRGDSEGETAKTTLADMVEDAGEGVRCLLDNGAEHVVLLGICSGAEVAYGAASCDTRVDSLVLWSAPIFAEGQSEEVRQARQRHYLREYTKKLFHPEAWQKLLTGRLQPRLIRQVLSGREAKEAPKTSARWREEVIARFRAFRGDVVMIYGTNDPVASTAVDWYQDQFAGANVPCELHRIVGANHSYYGWEWKQEVMTATTAWLEKRYPGYRQTD